MSTRVIISGKPTKTDKGQDFIVGIPCAGFDQAIEVANILKEHFKNDDLGEQWFEPENEPLTKADLENL